MAQTMTFTLTRRIWKARLPPPPPLKKEKENPKTNKLKISGKTQHRKFFLHTLLSNYFSNISV